MLSRVLLLLVVVSMVVVQVIAQDALDSLVVSILPSGDSLVAGGATPGQAVVVFTYTASAAQIGAQPTVSVGGPSQPPLTPKLVLIVDSSDTVNQASVVVDYGTTGTTGQVVSPSDGHNHYSLQLVPLSTPGTVTITITYTLLAATNGYFTVTGLVVPAETATLTDADTICVAGYTSATDQDTGATTCISSSSGTGDPQFSGLQGQNYQFHGMADEVFSLVSTPALQLNSLFKFIANGNCDYNNTVCWTHPGTYLGQIGVQFGATKILFQSGAHVVGMAVVVNDKQITSSSHAHIYHNGNQTLTMVYANGEVTLSTSTLYFKIVNSDYFFNMDFGVRDESIIRAGAVSLVIKGEVCEHENRAVKTVIGSKIQAKLAAAYPQVPMHGLLGQTWRNAVFCGRYFEGTVDDYVTGGLFSNDHTFNYYKSQ